MNQVLNKARDDAGKLAQNSLNDTNNVVRMVTAGSKGSFINISQVRPCVRGRGPAKCSVTSAGWKLVASVMELGL